MSPDRVRRPTVITPASPDARGTLLEPDGGYDPHPVAWQSVSVLPDERTLEITAVHGAGEQLHSVTLDESDPHLIVVTVQVAFEEPPGSGARTLQGFVFRARAQLSRPLDGRMALDGALGTDADVRERELAGAMRWRAELGLPTDRALVEELVEDARMPDGRLHGTQVLSDDEQLWYREAMRDKEAAADFAKGWLAVQDADLDAHGELTWYDGGAYIQYVATGEEGAAELRAAAEAEGIRRLRVVPVRYTYRELDRFHGMLRERLSAAGVGLARSGPEVSSNTVRLMVHGGLREVERARAAAGEVVPVDAVSVVPLG